MEEIFLPAKRTDNDTYQILEALRNCSLLKSTSVTYLLTLATQNARKLTRALDSRIKTSWTELMIHRGARSVYWKTGY